MKGGGTKAFDPEGTKIALGQLHTAIISQKHIPNIRKKVEMHKLYVWGKNTNREILDVPKRSIEEPTELRLRVSFKFGDSFEDIVQREYEPVSVVAGQSYTMVVARINKKYEEEYFNHERKGDKLYFTKMLGANLDLEGT